jgi:hypothetical protein
MGEGQGKRRNNFRLLISARQTAYIDSTWLSMVEQEKMSNRIIGR